MSESLQERLAQVQAALHVLEDEWSAYEEETRAVTAVHIDPEHQWPIRSETQNPRCLIAESLLDERQRVVEVAQLIDASALKDQAAINPLSKTGLNPHIELFQLSRREADTLSQ